MSVFEFQTYINNNTIKLSKEYREHIKGYSHVMIHIENDEEEEDMVEYLMDHPYQVPSFTPLTRDEVYERC